MGQSFPVIQRTTPTNPITLTMKNILILPALICSAQLLSAQVITNFSSDFNTGPANVALANYKQSDGLGSTLPWSATAGTGGGGGIAPTAAGVNNFYRIGTGTTETNFDFSALGAGGTYSTSIDMRINTTSTLLTTTTFGFTTDNSPSAMTLAGGKNIAGGVIRNNSSNFTLRMRSDSGNTATLDFAQSALTSNDWYRLTLDITKSATVNQFGYNLTLFSIGSAGTSTPVIFNDGTNNIQLTGTLTNSALYAATDIQWAIDARDTASDTGLIALDNFNVVPEPSTAILAMFGLAALAARTRSRVSIP